MIDSSFLLLAPLFVVAIYCLLTTFFIIGWQKAITPQTISLNNAKMRKVTVIVPFRNEAQSITQLLDSLTRQVNVDMEVILVNDFSDDGTLDVIEQWIKSNPLNLKILTTETPGKKGAIEWGVSHSSHSIIITTDADCTSGNEWLSHMAMWFDHAEVQFVFGAVRMDSEDSFFFEMQRIEFTSLIGSGAAANSFGYPIMCNGANLAFRKETFLAVDGYKGNEHVPSGDDEFLMRKINTSYPGSVVFNSSRESVVTTSPQSTIKQFFNQRIRWAGKWRMQTVPSIMLALFIVTANISFISLLINVLTLASGFAIAAVILKVLIDYIFLKKLSSFLRIRWRLVTFLILELLHPFYVVFFGVMANVSTFTWKGRSYPK